MDSEVQKQVLDAISAMAQGLQTTSAHLYEVLVKQAFVDGILGVIYAVLILVLIAVISTQGIKLVRWLMKRDEAEAAKDRFYSGGFSIGATLTSIIGVFILGMLVLGFCSSIRKAVTGFVNPEFGAIERVADYLNIHQNNGTK